MHPHHPRHRRTNKSEPKHNHNRSGKKSTLSVSDTPSFDYVVTYPRLKLGTLHKPVAVQLMQPEPDPDTELIVVAIKAPGTWAAAGDLALTLGASASSLELKVSDAVQCSGRLAWYFSRKHLLLSRASLASLSVVARVSTKGECKQDVQKRGEKSTTRSAKTSEQWQVFLQADPTGAFFCG